MTMKAAGAVTQFTMYIFWVGVSLGLVVVDAQYLNISDIRLIGGSGTYGRVEVNINGIWGTVCDYGFDMNDAKVMCRMLNLQATAFHTGGYYGQGQGPVFAQQFNCYGSESSLSSCRFVANALCTHNRDVGIICTECGEISFTNGMVNISADGKTLSTTCDEGFEAQYSQAVCESGTWSVPSLACAPINSLNITDIRLVNGVGLADGRVEILVNGTWGTICSNSFGWEESYVACIMLGFPGRNTYFTSASSYGEGTGPVYIANLECTYADSSLNDCTYDVVHTCTHSQDVGVGCNAGYLNITDVRLVNGSGPYDGRVEFLVDGKWGTIYQSPGYYISNGLQAPETVCRMLNLSLSTYFDTPVYGEGDGPLLMRQPSCYSVNKHINSCSYSSPYYGYDHQNDMTLSCLPCGIPPNIKEETVVLNGTKITAECFPGFSPSPVTMTCKDDAQWDKVCQQQNGYPLNIRDIRLEDIYSYNWPSEGLVRILVNGTWGGICSNMFDFADASVICKMMDLKYYSFSLNNRYQSNTVYGRNKVPVFIDNLDCSGNESHINECTYDVGNNCTYWDDVAVQCTGYQLNITDIRLSGTNSSYTGRVEVRINDTWGTVCDNYFYSTEAYVICRMLGFGRYYQYFHDAVYGQGTGPIFVDRLDCSSSSYDHINRCKYAPNNYYNFTHTDDVSVTCFGPTLNITGARLVNGSGPDDGRAEISVNGVWGTICDQNFNILAADLFCQISHKRAIKYYTGATHGPGTGPVHIEQIFCQTNHFKLSDCDYLHLNTCNHQRDVSVVCSACGQPDLLGWDVDFFQYNGSELHADCSYYKTYVGLMKMKCNNLTGEWYIEGQCTEYSYPLSVEDIRLVGGTNSSSGRVEIKSLGTWGTVCSHSFGMTEAAVICRMIGYPPVVSISADGVFLPGSGPIFVDDLSCHDNDSHINNCTYITHDNCQHTNDVAVTCADCGSPIPPNGYGNTTKSNLGSVVEVFCKSGYRMEGDDVITCQDNGKWSSNVPSCIYIDCRDPTPDNGESNTTETSNGTVANISCLHGYELIGNPVIVCMENDSWTDYPKCNIIDCERPNQVSGHVELPSNKTTYGEQAVITCWEGYRPEGSITVTCQANATWEQWAICEIVDCGDPTPARGIVNSTDTTYGVVVEVSCEEGFNLTGLDIITCLSDGSWSGSPICDTSDCGNVQLSNGNVATPNGTSVGVLAFASCNPGYDLSGSEILLCAEQGWNGTLTCQKQDCGDPTPENGVRTDDKGTLFGETATLACDEGYQLNGDKTISCEDGGNWSVATTCSLKDCGSVTLPANAVTDDGEGTKYSSTVRFSCLSGYILVGNSSIRCESTGSWSESPPKCIAKLSIGGNCQNNEQCLSAGAVCRNSVCTCITGIHDNNTNTCDAMPLLPYGPSEQDEEVPATSNCGPAIKFRPGIPLFTKKHTDVFVCASGYITFDSLYTNPTPPKDRQDANIRLNEETLLAPFYGNIDIANSGPVYYRTYDIMNSHSKMKRDAELISYIESIVKNFGDLANFETSFLLIATWTETTCVSDELFGNNKKTSTFQVVVASDGRNTFAFNIYGQGEMRWAEDINLSTKHCENVFVGYSAESNVLTDPMSYSQQALQLDQRLEPDIMSELDVAGLIFKSMTSPSYVHNNHAVDCIRWYNTDKEDRNDLDYVASLMPECPCDIWLSRFDPWFWQIGLHRWRTDEKYVCVDMLPTGNFAQYGKSCCYDLRTWSWVYERPIAGGFQLYHPQKYRTDNFVHDIMPKENCCVYSDNCYLFYRLRPSGSCYRRSPYRFGTFWGDPHFSTLDRLNFTFNGLGEFTLLQVRTENMTFDLQARTERAVKQDGNLSDATIFSAFAAKDSSNASVHVELNKAKTGINVYANEADVTNDFNSVVTPFEFTSEDGNIYLARSESALTVLFPQSGISLNISVNVGMLSLNTIVPQTLRNSTGILRGLLGNYDGNPYNDFMLPNGTVLTSNMTEREIFEYGINWAFDDEDSAFVYEEGKNHSHFHNATYVPRFLDEADLDKRMAAETLCGGHENFECIFDYVFTGQEAVAMATADLREQVDSDQELLETSSPSLTGCNTTQVTTGQRVTCIVDFDDNDNIEFIENSVGATFDKKSSAIIYIQKTDNPVDIQIVSTNAKNRSSPVFRLEIELCTGCSGHGNCTQEIRIDNKSTEYFKFLTCQCEPEYEGDDCEKVFDGCAASPCSHDRECIRLSAEQQKLLGRAYKCASCPTGYQEYGNTCKDINECNGTEPCQHMCNNTYGSFVCTCHSGYRVDPANTHACKDINECNEATHNCSQLCVNTDGGFNCTCHAGYYFNASLRMCLENEEPVCNATALQQCANTSGCTLDTHGDEVCFCDVGFKLDELGTSCQDVNECEWNVCQHTCNNTVGSFQCSCYTGYKLTGLTTCEECVLPFWGENCENKCICSERGADSCDSVRGCICMNGWEGVSCNDDIDECQANDNACSDPKTECLNTQGSYVCNCIAGYALQTDGLCGDIDECSSPLLNDCSDICTNNVGGYSCSCNTGFTASNRTHCTDIDECSLGRHHCQQQCVNRAGSYSCFCHFGYTLNDDRHGCEEQNNFCSSEWNLTCDHYCLLEEEMASCRCYDGYSLGADNQTCTDINECYSSELNQCDLHAACTNIEGSYLCLCSNGTKLENNGRTCTECDSFHFGVNCSETCSCVRGLCDKTTGCNCDPGWTGDQCDQDVDECASGKLMCDEANSVCVNTPGTAKCSCSSGFVNTSGICTECTGNTYGSNCLLECNCNATNANNTDQTCSAVTGDCVCNAFWTGTLCDDDVNECDALSTCNSSNHEVCVNTVGLFRCDCLRGFTEDLDGTCTEDVQSITLPKETNLMINLTITIDYDLPAANNLNSSVVYRDIESAINNSLVQFYTRFIQDTVVVVIWDIRRGSLVVDYSVVTTQSDDTNAQLIEATSALVTGTTIQLEGQNTNVVSDSYTASELCDLYEALLGTCSKGYRCVVSNGQPSCRLEGEEKEDWPVFVGITVGVVVFIIVLAAGGMWCLQHKNKKNRETRHATILERETSSVFRSVENWKYGQGRKNQTLRDVKARAICPEYEDIYAREPTADDLNVQQTL